ncbi:MAG: site-2 protease family protein [Christensenellales bacterium]
MFDFLQRDPGGFLLFMLYRAPAVLLALTLHEVAHGAMALRCGDPTARDRGRLSLNPLKHLDPIGTLFLFFLGFGWAKPVPVDPRNFRRGSRDDLLVSLAGVATNFLLFLLSTLLSILVGFLLYRSDLRTSQDFRFFLGFSQQGFGVQLFPEYAASLQPLLQTPWLLHLQRFILHLCMINLGLCLFNLLPIPPLDGFHVFNDLILKGRLHLNQRAFQIAQAALLLLMFATNIVSDLVSGAINLVQCLVLSGALALFGL